MTTSTRNAGDHSESLRNQRQQWRRRKMQRQHCLSSIPLLINTVLLLFGLGMICLVIPDRCIQFLSNTTNTTSVTSNARIPRTTTATIATVLHQHPLEEATNQHISAISRREKSSQSNPVEKYLNSDSCHSTEDTSYLQVITMCITRMAGSVLVALGLACIMLVYPTIASISSSRSSHQAKPSTSIHNLRLATTIQALTGLLWIVCSLLLKKTAATVALMSLSEGRKSELNLVGIQSLSMIFGFTMFLLSSISFLISTWPVQESERPSSSDHMVEDSIERASVSPLVEPLLPQDENTNGSDHDLESTHAEPSTFVETDDMTIQDLQTDGNADNSTEHNHSLPTSRIQGTRRLFQLAAPQLTYLYIGCVVLLIRLPFSLCIPHFVSTTISSLAESNFDRARHEIFWLFLLGTVDALLDFGCIFFFGLADQRILRRVRVDTFAAILRQEVAFFDNHTTGELSSRLTADCGALSGDLTWFFRFSIESVVRISGITTYMLIRSPKLGAVALSILPVIAAVNKVYGDWLSQNARRVQDALAAANSVSQETLACIRTVIAFASERLEYDKYVDRINEQFRLNVRQTYMTGIYYMFISTFLINTVVQGTLLLVGSYMIQRGNLTSEILLAFMLYQGQLQNEMLNLFNSYSSLIKSSGAGDKVFELLDRAPPPPATGSSQVIVSEDGNGYGIDDDGVEGEGRQSESMLIDSTSSMGLDGDSANTPMHIEFKNVNFFYPSRGRDNLVLKGLDLTVPAGKTVALVGPSGSGKSTIIGLCERFYDTTSGRIFIDGVDIRSLDIKSHRRRIGVVTQDPMLFSGTILDNILYGSSNSSSTIEAAFEASKRANADQFIRGFPKQYDTEVGERGVCLSGGQKQRIAISRAIIRHPSLLLLDEATSALDPDSEHVVQKSIDDLLNTSKGITTIIVAHRLRTVRNADLIAVLKDGRIIERGSHDDLMSIGPTGYYAGMVAKSRGDKLEE